MTHEIRTIICPIDFSESSKAALNEALSLAERFGSSVEVVHTVEVPHPSTQAIADGLHEYADKELGKLVKHLPKGGPKLSSKVLQGPPAASIVEYANGAGADLIVLSTHGRSGFMRAMLGSVAERIVRTSRCPVLTIPAAEGDDASASGG